MSELLSPLFISGFLIGMFSAAIGCYFALRDKEPPEHIIGIGISIAAVGFLMMGIDIIQTSITAQNEEKIVTDNIENMTCNQLHNALLHNKINGTSHIQRATERYVAGCETK